MAYAIVSKASSATPRPLLARRGHGLCHHEPHPANSGESSGMAKNSALVEMTDVVCALTRLSSTTVIPVVETRASRYAPIQTGQRAVLVEGLSPGSMPVVVTVIDLPPGGSRRREVGMIATVTSDIHSYSGYHCPSIVADALASGETLPHCKRRRRRCGQK